jgi:hypothetical protein
MSINQLQLPGALPSNTMDFSPLANLGQIHQKAQAEQGVKEAFAGGIGTDPQSLSALAGKVSQFNPQLGMTLAQLANTQENTLYSRGRDTKNDTRQASLDARQLAQDALANQHWNASFGLQKAASERAGEDKFVIKEITDPNTNATSLVRVKTTGGEGPINVGLPPPSAPNNPFSAGGKFNGDQGKAAGFTDRMLGSEAVLSGVAPEGGIGPVAGVQDQGTKWLTRDLHQAPFGISNQFITPDQQKFNQAKADFINAQLRRESGAAIGKDEYKNADTQYFPQPGDGPDVIAQKSANRRLAIEAMGREGGGSYKPKLAYREDGALAPYGQPSATQPVMNARSAPADAGQQSNPATFRAPPRTGELRDGYRFKGGNPGDPASWVKASG